MTGLAALGAVGTLIWAAAPGEPRLPADTAVEEAASEAPTARRHSYRLRLRATTDVALTGPSDRVSGRLDLDGTLAITELGVDRYAARLGPLDRAVVTILGKTAPVDALDGVNATVTLDAGGGIASLAFEPEASAVARSVLRTALVEVGPIRFGPSGATVERASMFGTGPLTERGAGADRVRERDGYTALTFAPETAASVTSARGRWTVELDERGVIARLAGGERVTLREAGEVRAEGRSQIALTSTGSDAVDLATAERAAAARVPGSAPARAPSAARVALEQRAGGLTTARLVSDLRAYGDAGRMPRHDAWLWRASGWLKLHPEASEALVDEALAPERTALARGLVVDLLASVGHAEAQAGLRRLLDAPELTADSRWGELVQHLVLLPRPDAETVAWLGDRYRNASSAERGLAVASVLGAAAGKVARGGDPEAGLAARAPLVEALAATTSGGDRLALLDALGNAGLAADAELIAGWASAGDAGLRAAAARALRKLDDGASRGVLLGLVADPSAAVAREAIRALSGPGLDEAGLSSLRELVSAGALREGAYGALIELAARTEGADAAVVALLDALVDARSAPAGVRAVAAREARNRRASLAAR